MDALTLALNEEGVTGDVADIARSIYQQESSSGKNTKTSNAGARGGMQIIPTTFNRMADKGWDINDPVNNARAGVRYINALYTKAGGDPALTAAGYYGGEGAIDKAKKGIAVSDPRNPKAPNTLQYGKQVADRIKPTFSDDENTRFQAMYDAENNSFTPDENARFQAMYDAENTQQNKQYTPDALIALHKQGVNIGNMPMQQRTFKDDLQSEIEANPWDAKAAAFGAGASTTWEGAKQLLNTDFRQDAPAGAFGKAIDYNVNGGAPQDNTASNQQIQSNEMFRDNNPAMGVAGDVAMYAGSGVAAPAVNTVKGGAMLAGGLGFLQPADTMQQRVGNGLVSAGVAAGATKAVLAIGNSALARVAAKKAAQAANYVRDTSVKLAQDAGFSIPRSMYNPTTISNSIESFGGKAAVKQDAMDANQKMADSFARKTLGVSDDTPMDDLLLADLRKQAAMPYRAAEELTPEVVSKSSIKAGATGKNIQQDVIKDGKQLVQEINEARDTTRALWADSKSATGTARNAAREAAKASEARLSTLENQLDKMAINQGKPQLVKELSKAREQIAKIYTVDDALNKGTGSIDATVIAKKYQKGKPLDENLKQVGRFAKAFEGVAPKGKALSGGGVSALNAGLSVLAAGAGASGTNSPYGATFGLLPLLARPAARAATLSKLMQKAPNYNLGAVDYLSKVMATRYAPSTFAGLAAPAFTE